MVEKLAISEEVCNHISDREAMLSIMILFMIYVSVAKTSARYRGKLAFLPAAGVSKKPNISLTPVQQFFFSTRGRQFSSSPIRGVNRLALATLIPGSIFPVQFSRWKLEPTSMVIFPGEVSWERCINRIASLASSLKML